MPCRRAARTGFGLLTAACLSLEFVSVALAQEHLLLGVAKGNGILLMSCWQYVSEARTTQPSCFTKNDGGMKVLRKFLVVLIVSILRVAKIGYFKSTTLQ
jgi:hypothetical protein